MTAQQQAEIEELIMEVLIARWRLGENLWPFNHTKPIVLALQALELKGWVHWKGGVVENTLNVFPTPEGIAHNAGSDYNPPARRLTIQQAKADAWDEAASAANDYIRLDDGIEETELIAANPYREGA